MTATSGLEAFQSTVAACPPTTLGPMPSEARLAALASVLPCGMIDLYRTYGFSSYCDGLYRFVDPLPYAPLVHRLFDGDTVIDPATCFVTGFSAFGHFHIWSAEHYEMFFDPFTCALTCHSIGRDRRMQNASEVNASINQPELDSNRRAMGLIPTDLSRIDYHANPGGRPLFKWASKRFGPPARGHILTWELAEDPRDRMRLHHRNENMVHAPIVSALLAFLDGLHPHHAVPGGSIYGREARFLGHGPYPEPGSYA